MEIQGEPPPINLTIYCRITLILLFTFSLICILKEIFQMYCNGRAYFSDLVNYVEWGLYVSAIIFCAPLFSSQPTVQFNWAIGSLALFLTWFNILFFLQ
uniref:Uncharacterized protein n=1 Tax=Romanomermis culicivorax TaxID=13658 RepID=A0A915HU38_ROMCU